MKKKQCLKIAVTGGGTGGHLFPGIAVAEAFLKRFAGSEALFIGTRRLMDNKVLAGRAFDVRYIDAAGIKGKSLGQIVASILRIPTGLWQAARLLRKFKPAIVVGVGGYVTGPVVLAARLMGIPCAIHEQNSVPGLANRLLGRIANRIFLSIPGSDGFFPAGKWVMTGNPVRSEMLRAAGRTKRDDDTNPTILVLGGSLGAHALNVLLPEVFRIYKNQMPAGLTVLHQTGVEDSDVVRKAYAESGVTAEVVAFIDNMAEAYTRADLVVSRAGATTLAEITVMKKPAVLIPYPFAADNHQEKNAQWLVEGGAALMYKQEGLTAENLGADIVRLMNSREELAGMSEKAWQLARPGATATIMEQCLELMAA